MADNKLSVPIISKIFLILLIASININAPNFFMTKEIFFLLLIFSSFMHGDYSKISSLILMLTIYLISLSYNITVPGSNLTIDNGLTNILGMLYLFLLVYNRQEYSNTIIKAYLYSSLVTSFIILIVWTACYYSAEIKNALIIYFESIENDKVAFIFMIRERKILDWWLPSVYYGTAPCIVPSLGYCLAQKLHNTSIKYTIISIIFFITLILTGARANMLSAIILIFLYIGIKLHISQHRLSSASFTVTTFAVIIYLSAAFLGDKEESSLQIKILHQMSYQIEFDSDLIRTIFFGWGGGSTFFALAYNDYVNLTELSLQETIRRYGIISTLMIFIFIWLKPLSQILNRPANISVKYLGVALIAYIFVASTNPFLLGSIGFAALLFFSVAMEHDAFRPQKITEQDNC